MKSLLRTITFNLLALWVTSNFIPIFSQNNFKALLTTALVLTAFEALIKPVVEILVLPLNLISFKAFFWVPQTFVLYLTTLVLPQFNITAFSLPQFSFGIIQIPTIHFGAFTGILFLGFLLSLSKKLLKWLLK